MYDVSAGFIETPSGIGKFIEFDGNTGMVTVEMDYSVLVEFDASRCYVLHQ